MVEETVICLEGSCREVEDETGADEVIIITESSNSWVKPAICVSIVLVAVIFFSFMYFGRSWLEGSAKVSWTERRDRDLLGVS